MNLRQFTLSPTQGQLPDYASFKMLAKLKTCLNSSLEQSLHNLDLKHRSTSSCDCCPVQCYFQNSSLFSKTCSMTSQRWRFLWYYSSIKERFLTWRSQKFWELTFSKLGFEGRANIKGCDDPNFTSWQLALSFDQNWKVWVEERGPFAGKCQVVNNSSNLAQSLFGLCGCISVFARSDHQCSINALGSILLPPKKFRGELLTDASIW